MSDKAFTSRPQPLQGFEHIVPVAGSTARNDRMAVHHSSETDLWATPQVFFDDLDREFHFTLDVCATAENAKCDRFFSPEINGLVQDWTGTCWCNPPYGSEIGWWIKKALESSQSGATVVCLVPSRTDTAWWHDYAAKASEIRFVRGRLKFGSAENSAPFPSAVLIFLPCQNHSLQMPTDMSMLPPSDMKRAYP